MSFIEKRNLRGSSTAGRQANNSNKRRSFKCDLCPSSFGSKMELEEHINSHTGVKPFTCKICGANFNRRSTLWNHKRIHGEQKPFQCPICRLEFKWKNSLKCHREIHLRNKDKGSEKFDLDIINKMSFTGTSRRSRRILKPENEIIEKLQRKQKQKQQQEEKEMEKSPPVTKFLSPITKIFDENGLEKEAESSSSDETAADPNDFQDLIVFLDDNTDLVTVEIMTEEEFDEVSEQDLNESLFLTRLWTPAGRYMCLDLPKVCVPDEFQDE